MNDNEIIDLYFKRDQRALAETSGKYERYCMSVSMNIVKNTQDAEECVNDTYVRTWESIPPERPNVFRLFLAEITRNLSLDRYRKTHAYKHGGCLEVMFSELSECIPVIDEQKPRGQPMRALRRGKPNSKLMILNPELSSSDSKSRTKEI